MSLKMRSSHAGFTLTELMVALVVNVFLFSAITAICSANLSQYMQTSNRDLLTSQLQAVLDLMTNDIRRAGYWSNASSNIQTDTNTNPFMSTASGTDISVNTGNNCILFTYDHNATGTLPAISNSADDDRYGYRLNGTVIQARPWGATFACNAASNAWENVTDPTIITVTNLTFTLSTQTVSTGTSSLAMRSVDISITGQLTNNSSVTRTVTQHVRIRNDKFIP